MAINILKGNNVHYELTNMNTSTSLLLQSPALSANMTLEDVAGLYENMRKETILKQYCDTSKIKERKADKYTQFYILISGKQYTAKTRPELINKLY